MFLGSSKYSEKVWWNICLKIHLLIRERVRLHVRGGRAEGEGERVPSWLGTGGEPNVGLDLMTWAETSKSWMLHQLSHPHTPIVYIFLKKSIRSRWGLGKIDVCVCGGSREIRGTGTFWNSNSFAFQSRRTVSNPRAGNLFLELLIIRCPMENKNEQWMNGWIKNNR